MKSRHANISIFVPHIGCPNRCSFCDQRSITGSHRAPTSGDVTAAVETALKTPDYNPENTEIAFFGGSFTAINRNYMTSLLETAAYYARSGAVSGIRISTRPDAVDDEILSILKDNYVTSIELGAQSLDDGVLRSNNRGHTAKDVENASRKIKDYGFSLGLQMMTGLYSDTDENAIKTAEKIIELKPDTVRIYPTIVLKKTDLAALFADGVYTPQSLTSAVSLSVKLLKMFGEAGIDIIRLGLHSIEEDSFVAGPWHPAFSELCYSEIYLEKAKDVLMDKPCGKYNLYVNPSAISKMTGQKRSNISALEKMGYFCKIKGDVALEEYEIITERT